ERWHGARASWTAAVLCRFYWDAPDGKAPRVLLRIRKDYPFLVGQPEIFFERFFFGTRTDYRKRTIAPERNDMTTLEPKQGLRAIPTIHVLEAQNSPAAGPGSPTQAAQTDSHRIPPSSEKARVLAVKKKSIPC